MQILEAVDRSSDCVLAEWQVTEGFKQGDGLVWFLF